MDPLLKVAGQVQGLETVLRAVLALQLAAQVKDESGFAKAKLQADSLRDRILAHVDSNFKTSMSPAAHTETGIAIHGEVTATIARCFNDASSMIDEVSKIVLELSTAASDSKN